jgi:hypothetical protein
MSPIDAHPPLPTSDELELAYRIGNFSKLRRDARRVLNDDRADAHLRDTAQTLYARATVDRWTLAALGFAVLSFCVIVSRYVF